MIMYFSPLIALYSIIYAQNYNNISIDFVNLHKKYNEDMSITILGIESSCDDTSSSIIRDGVMLSNVIASQAVHESYGE